MKRHGQIYLTGFMGSGKSTLAPILANTLGYNLIDLDREIEKIAGLSISAVFKEKGEAYFRSVEESLLSSFSVMTDCVISLGGGTISSAHNLETIKRSGTLIYLKLDPAKIFDRIRMKVDRPLLLADDGTRVSDKELHVRIRRLLTIREPLYLQAHFTVDVSGRTIGSIIDEILRILKQ